MHTYVRTYIHTIHTLHTYLRHTLSHIYSLPYRHNHLQTHIRTHIRTLNVWFHAVLDICISLTSHHVSPLTNPTYTRPTNHIPPTPWRTHANPSNPPPKKKCQPSDVNAMDQAFYSACCLNPGNPSPTSLNPGNPSPTSSPNVQTVYGPQTDGCQKAETLKQQQQLQVLN